MEPNLRMTLHCVDNLRIAYIKLFGRHGKGKEKKTEPSGLISQVS